jgi:hypothetical protein
MKHRNTTFELQVNKLGEFVINICHVTLHAILRLDYSSLLIKHLSDLKIVGETIEKLRDSCLELHVYISSYIRQCNKLGNVHIVTITASPLHFV